MRNELLLLASQKKMGWIVTVDGLYEMSRDVEGFTTASSRFGQSLGKCVPFGGAPEMQAVCSQWGYPARSRGNDVTTASGEKLSGQVWSPRLNKFVQANGNEYIFQEYGDHRGQTFEIIWKP